MPVCKKCKQEKVDILFATRIRDGKSYQVANCLACEATDPNKHSGRYLQTLGLDVVQIRQFKDQQNNKCAICNSTTNLVIDHCHTTGQLRGLLCDKCNRGLGYFNDSVELFNRVIQYLQRPKLSAPNLFVALDTTCRDGR